MHHEVRWSMIRAADNRNAGRPRTRERPGAGGCHHCTTLERQGADIRSYTIDNTQHILWNANYFR